MLKKFIVPFTIVTASAVTLLVSCGKSNTLSNGPVIVKPDTTKKVAPVYSLVWSDEFDETTIDATKWGFDLGNLGVNDEEEFYQAQNAAISNGNLVITVQKQLTSGQPYTSARMKTQDKFSMTYGRIEARIKMPVGVGMWPAFWMLGANINTVSWPTCGEIDIMEHINTDSLIHGSLHWNGGNTTQQLTSTPSDYHIYAVEWDANEIRFYVDSTLYDTEPTASIPAFQLPFFLILNVAAGGDWPGQTVDQSILPASMYVDYVRVYKQTN
jgi:beta-glucanase (GH16 family)